MKVEKAEAGLELDVPGLTSGALSMYDSKLSTGYRGLNSVWLAFAPPGRYWIRVRSSARIVKSRIKGVARRES